MSLYGAFDTTKHFDELDSPIVTQEGTLTPAQRKARCLANLGVDTLTASELSYLDITTLGTGAASKAIVLDASGDYVYPATGVFSFETATDGLVMGAGTSASPVALGTTAGTALNFRFRGTNTTGDMRGMYLRLDFAGSGGSGEALRVFTEVENVSVATGGTVNGAHISFNVDGSSGAVSGAGNAIRATLEYGTGVTSSGTVACIQIDLQAASGVTMTNEAGLRFTTSGTGKWPFAFAFDTVAGSGNAVEAITSAMSTNPTSFGVHISVDGAEGWIPVYDNNTWS